MPRKALLSALPFVLLAGCALQPPDPAPLVEGCANVPVSAAVDDESQQFFFLSTAIPDCRDGGFRLAPYRHPDQTYGSGMYELIEGEAQPPTLAKHDRDDWFMALESAINTHPQRRVIVFIHGYATSFEEAHKDAAEVRALGASNIPLVVLHWPSRNNAQDYLLDRASIGWAQDSIIETLGTLTILADDITLVTHSMGAQAGTSAVLALDELSAANSAVIKRIVLASPDFDRDRALRIGGTVDQLLGRDRKLLVYASEKDKALRASRTVNGYARLGTTSCEFDLVYERRALGKEGNCHLTAPRQGFAIVDTGPSMPGGYLRHNDFLDSCHVRADIAAFLRDEPPPAYRVQIGDEENEGYVIDPSITFDGAPCEPISDD
ncbi:alpha/beta fold hydrolase [Altererythrobacter lutimaris]|uniref:Alpha/beta fold hydrolase n=1 Tax=Altererythrobacter lutimaris TaxID=2743979 RepID=A0A850HGS9_9SPHN|nr:alpha/beta fold hydrolase [Altererythrobacter lutimaris]NVE94062.1 alpha/beta fold hydrolase [Altererythrobacter lutimaris]